MTDAPDLFDPSTLKARFESARKSAEAVPKNPELESQIQSELRAEIKRLRAYAEAHPDDAIVKANPHLLHRGLGEDAAAPAQTFPAAGTVNLTGGVWWALGGAIMFPPPYGFLFGSKGGPDWVAGGFTSGMLGSFVIDPVIIRKDMTGQEVPVIGQVYKGRCKFQLSAGGAGAGAVRISFYSLTGTYWGMFGGISAGLNFASISDECDLVWS